MENNLIEKTSAYIIKDAKDRNYFSKAQVDEGIVVVFGDVYYFVDARYYYAVDKDLISKGVIPVLYESIDSVKTFFDQKCPDKIYMDYDKTFVNELKHYSQTLNREILDCSKVVKELRSIKSKEEIKTIKKACEITQKVFYEVIKDLKEGVSEQEISDKISALNIKYGAQSCSFETIVAFGEGSAIPHHKTSSRKLQKNEPVLIDMGCVVDGYASDFTRTVFFGEPSKDFIEKYDLVLNANLIAEQNIKANNTGKEADAFARDYLKLHGEDKAFTHSLGHGIGLYIHEFPFLSPRSSDILKEGTVFSVEPGLYYTDNFGIRIEDTVVIEDGAIKRLFTDDKNLIIL